ncbi:ABC transporter permease [Actinospongicola halichondriae]|uniref:ABC transporter permease n=1 Tax=Actinospongicola halichondriae TaxID=3236844 RepID=UPI003D3E1D6C
MPIRFSAGGRSHLGARLTPFAPPIAIILFQQIVYPLPLGVLTRGVLVGAVTSLIALGMALIYRSNRIVNFAQGDLGAAPAVLVFLLLTEWGWPYPVAVAAGALSAFALGGLVELAVIRRFFAAPRLVLTVATIGLAQLLTGLAIFLPRWFGVDGSFLAPRIDDPFDVRIEIGGTIFRGNSVLAFIITPIAIVGLVWFLRWTRLGVAIRASADRADRAALLGVPVKRLQTLVWAIAALLAFTATFLRAGILGLPVGSVLSLGILLRSLTALLLGGMTRLTVIGSSAIALGVLELGIDWHQGETLPFVDFEFPPLDAVLALVILVALLLRRRSASRTDLDDQSSWQSTDEVRPVPAELARLPEVRWGRIGMAVAIAAIALALPHVLAVDASLKASALLIYAILTMSLVVLTGWAGQVSLGQVAFFAIGAAVAGKLTDTWSVDLVLAVLIAGLVGAVVAVAVGLPALRFGGFYLAVTTFAFALATTAYFLNRAYFDWIPNRRIARLPLFGRIDIDSPTRIYYVMLAALVLVLIGLRGVRHSRTGRVLVALRDNEAAVQAYGVDVVRAKLTAFAVSGFTASVAGGLFVHHQQAFGSSPYAPAQNLSVFAMAVVGGISSLPGALLGALYVLGTQWFLPLQWQFLASGLGILIVLMILPTGLGGLLFSIRNQGLRWIANRRSIVVPSLVADRRDDGPTHSGPLPGQPGAAPPPPVDEPETISTGSHS